MRLVGRLLLAGVLLFAGVAHFRLEHSFLGQVPTWFVFRPAVVYVSGVIELLLGTALLVAPRERDGRPWRAWLGVVVALFFIAVFPGNITQWATGSDSFGLDTDTKRAVRLVFQPPLVVWALWCTGGWTWLRARLTGVSTP